MFMLYWLTKPERIGSFSTSLAISSCPVKIALTICGRKSLPPLAIAPV
jgi:hypothetical protein